MSRLADYFVVVGIDKDDTIGEELKSKVIQRFPEHDRKDAAFPQGIELFCQPGGWKLSYYSKPPTYFVAVLTDMDGDHRYCACFTFYEPFTCSSRLVKKDDEYSDSSSAHVSSQQSHDEKEDQQIEVEAFVPRCLCLVSRVTFFHTLKNCLITIYLSYATGNTELLEKLIGCMLGFVKVPPPGGPKLTFSIGAGDRQSLSPPLSDTLPVTGKSVALIFNQLGIYNMLSLFCAMITENKILFYSISYSKLTQATQAMMALMYPMKFSYVYIPILPAALLDFLSAPTPFIMGVHSSYKDNTLELTDIIQVDLDGGHVFIPDSINLSLMPEPLLSRTRHALYLVLNPVLINADYAFSPRVSPSPMSLLDKEIRAVFIRLMAEMFSGYRSCLTLIRIHPKPVITFHKPTFLEMRGMVGDEFVTRVLESISFTTFVSTHGPPYREVDLFDKILAEIDETIQNEAGVDAEILADIQSLAQKLYDNEPYWSNSENNLHQGFPAPLAGEKSGSSVRQGTFPALNPNAIKQFIQEEETHKETYIIKPIEPENVPCGKVYSRLPQHFVHGRKLEVLKDCVSYIFENKISEARKALPSVLRALKSKGAQLALCNDLARRAKQHRAVLAHDQFDLVVRLMNCALQDDASRTSSIVAASLLPLTATFCRKLSTGVIQFAYTCVQDHAIWESQQFWEETFYSDVQSQIRALYADDDPQKDELVPFERTETPRSSRNSMIILPPGNNTPLTHRRSHSGSEILVYPGSESKSDLKKKEEAKKILGPLDIAAEQLSQWASFDDSDQRNMIASEESIVYSQAIHYANRMVYMRVPLNVSTLMPAPAPPAPTQVISNPATATSPTGGPGTPSTSNGRAGAGNSSGSSSAGGSSHVAPEASSEISALPGESAMGSICESVPWDLCEDEDGNTIADVITRFVLRFVDRVGTEAGINSEHMRSLYAMIPGVVAMHIESLEPVYMEYKQLAPIRKAKIMRPALLPGEEMQVTGLRCYLIPDGRELGTGGEQGGPCLLPAEGAVFLTNYRIVFKGTPVDQYASEMIVTRSFPVASLNKEKKFGAHYLEHVQQWSQDSLQLRSNTFQLIKLAFDEEVEAENVELFRKKLLKFRYPMTIFNTFAFNGQSIHRTPTFISQRLDKRQGTLRKTRKKLSNVTITVNKGSIKNIRTSIRKRKHALHTGVHSSKSVERRSPSGSLETNIDDEDNSSSSSVETRDIPLCMPDAMIQGVDRLNSMPCCQDYSRIGFGSVLRGSASGPWRISMVNLTYTVCRSYPAVVVVPQQLSDDTILKVTKLHHHSRFPVAVWRHPRNKGVLMRAGGIERASMASLIKTGIAQSGGSMSGPHGVTATKFATLEQERFFAAMVAATPLSKSRAVARQQSLHHGAALSSQAHAFADLSFRDYLDGSVPNDAIDSAIMKKGWEPASVYVFGDKSLLRNVKQEAHPKCEFVPVEMPDVRAVRASMKKLMRACSPSSVPKEDNAPTFLGLIQESEWLQQIAIILQVSGAVVDLMDLQGSSVMVCFEDGWDVTSQVVSLIELLQDSYYRTIEGFKVLVEKEWLAFGHRFSYRGNQTAATQGGGFTPIFLQFLDCVYQVLIQYPTAFEFNNFFLCTVAYHYTSCRFRTFLLDSEHERNETGWLSEDDGVEGGDEPQSKHKGNCLWEYIEYHHKKSSQYHNFYYSPGKVKILRPQWKIANLKVWDYYLRENMSTGPIFDLELLNEIETTTNEEQQSAEDRQLHIKKYMSGCYGDVTVFARDECTWLLQEVSRLEEEADLPAHEWKNIWDMLEPPLPKRTQSHAMVKFAKVHNLAVHRRSTMEIVLKCKLQVDDPGKQGFSQPHNFVHQIFLTPTNCDYCVQLMWGFVRSAGLKCTECGYNCHDKCQSQVPWQCKKMRAFREQSAVTMAHSTKSLPENDNSSKQADKVYSGSLHKRGVLLKQWKARWFVLDTVRNQLRYYDTEHDTHCQGYIDLGEIVAICPVVSPQGAPKGADKAAFFDVKTTKRTYYLFAETKEKAEEWVERLQSMNV